MLEQAHPRRSLSVLALAMGLLVPMLGGCSSGPALDFMQGQRTQQLYGSITAGDRDGDWLAEGHYGMGYFVADNVSVNIEAFAGVADEQDDDETLGLIGTDGIVRVHTPPIGGENSPFRLHLDGGGGLQYATDDFPGDTAFNFRLFAGPGFTYRLSDNAHLIGTVRYFHISNAGISDGNSGVDTGQIGLGVMWAW